MVVNQDCADCARLWEEYARATAKFFRLDDRGKRAALAHDVEAIARLLIDCEAAAKARGQAREAYNEHRTAIHHYSPIGDAAA